MSSAEWPKGSSPTYLIKYLVNEREIEGCGVSDDRVVRKTLVIRPATHLFVLGNADIMIKRVLTRCLICSHNNTLRITLGTESRQEHTFACAACNEENRLRVEIDFKNREKFELTPEFTVTYPKASFTPLENCELCEEEGTVTNLDPNFLVPEELLHKDRVFPWMYTARGMLPDNLSERPPDEKNKGPKLFDVLAELGIPRDLSNGIESFCRAWRMHGRNQGELVNQQLTQFGELSGVAISDIWHAAVVSAYVFLGDRAKEISKLLEELNIIRSVNPHEVLRLRDYVISQDQLTEMMDRHVAILTEYRRGIDQFNQTWVYASRGEEPQETLVASITDLRAVKMFYGNAFEQLASMLALPACLNNIRNARRFEEFETMTLSKYLTINKARRADPFASNRALDLTHDEFDSTLRNASHHGALRISARSGRILEYRSGDSGQWKTLTYSSYLLKCNRVQMSLFSTMLILVWLTHQQ